MGDQNDAAIQFQHDSFQTVTSVGNSWIMCRSKSHAGRIYYFNTYSGEAAWNLSEQEIEKAKTRTKILESQSGRKFEGCPEPKDPPIDHNRNCTSLQTSQLYIPSRVYNKQIINNQFSKQPSSTSTCTKCSPVTTVDAMGVSFPVPHNPNVWTIPPHHQIVIAPAPSILNQLQTSVNIPCNDMERMYVENTSFPLTRRFNQFQNITPNKKLQFRNGIIRKNSNNAFGQRNGGSPRNRKKLIFTGPKDLRQRLSARRSNNACNNLNKNCYYQDEDVDNSDNQMIQIIKPSIEDVIILGDADEQWLKENATVQGTQLLLNVTPLRQLVTTDLNSTWYIVADVGVLLNHVNLIDVVVNSDEKCQLLVPDFVLSTLQAKSRANDLQLLSKAHHILQLISRLLITGNAVMGKCSTSDCTIYDFCYKLKAQNHNAVLISNNVQWIKIGSIITLNVQELKDMLYVIRPVRRFVDNSTNKITIPNKRNATIENNTHVNDSKPLSARILFDNKKIEETQTNSSNDFDIKKDVTPKPNPNADIGKQTNLNLLQELSPKENTEMSNLNEKRKDHFTSNSNEIPKRKEIRLKRKFSHQPVTNNNVDKKQFKWRRKRNLSMPNASATDKNTSFCCDTFNTEEKNRSVPEPIAVDNILMPESRSTTYEPADGSETSSSVLIRKSLDDKVVIEETSTSGVISNSADSESMHSIKHNELMYNKRVYDQTDDCKCVMFEVESPVMEEYLKIRSEEWVSRFVQIMEEVLTQILQQPPVFFNRTLPPPWTLHEATECIKKKFENDSDVKDAAYRLTNVLFKISDSRGKISVNMKPSEFMEMYSYGVYMVDALQSVLSNCEDLQTASDSLAKLLCDIQDPTLDTSHADAFTDNFHLSSANVTETNTDTLNNDSEKDIPEPKEEKFPDLKSPTVQQPINNTKERKYNLRSSQIKQIEDEQPTNQPVVFIRNIDIESNFFSSLNLKKNQYSSEDTNGISTNRNTCLNTLFTSKQNKIPKILNNAETQNDEPSNEPKIIRNFSKCLEFEEQLKNNQKETMEVDALADYQSDDDGYDYYDDYSHCEYDYYENGEELDKNETYGGKDNESNVINKNSNTDLKPLMGRFINKIQETFLEVHSFCAKIIEELSAIKTSNLTLSPPRKLEIKEKAETARLLIDNLSKSLKSIIIREEGNCDEKLQDILKDAGINLDGNKSIEYRNIIAQYPKQAEILLDAVNIVIEAVN